MTAMEFNKQLTNLQNNLQYFATKLTGNNEDANDLMQDTYLKALKNREKFEDDTNLKAWTFTIMKNTYINNYRKTRNINGIMDNTDDLFNLNIQCKSDFPAPDSEFHTKEINSKISKLSNNQRVPFELYHSGYKYHEIAEKLNISIGTVKSRIFLSRQKLMDSLKDYQN
jgi:RNA polymerase sigma factor (sigma-70 family)